MTKKRATADSTVRRRSLARKFNDSLTSATAPSRTADKRTQGRLARYRAELKSGKTSAGRALTPLDVAHRVDQLLTHGERVDELRKLLKPRVVEYDEDVVVGILQEMHPVYGYRRHAYKWAGVRDETLVAAGVIDKMPAKRGPKPKAEREGGKRGTTKKPKPPAKNQGTKARTPAKKRHPRKAM